jgi:hypothetical protein
MHRRLSLLAVLAALVALAGVVPAAAQVDDMPVLEYERLVATASLTLSEDGGSQVSDLGGSLVTVNPAGQVLGQRPFHTSASEFRAASADLPNFPCVYDSDRDGFIAYPPANLSVDDKNEKGGFRFFSYSVDGARRRFGQGRTVQFLMCGIGGVDAQNGSRLTVSGPGMAYNDSEMPHILGTNWKSGKTPKDYSINLGFQTDGKPVSVSGGISQNPSNSLKGSVLPPYGEHPMENFHENAANAWWEEGCRPRCRRWNGSADYQGSVAQALWEFPQGAKPTVLQRGFILAPYYEHFCANPSGC